MRDAYTGDPVAGAVVVPTNADTSIAVIRYLNDVGDGFVTDATSSQGVFVIVTDGLGETFGVENNGMDQGLTGTAGSANGADLHAHHERDPLIRSLRRTVVCRGDFDGGSLAAPSPRLRRGPPPSAPSGSSAPVCRRVCKRTLE